MGLARPERRTIWVVDDSSLDAEHARRALEGRYGVQIFGDGSAALEHLASNGAPDVLILDWNMPGITGVDVCRFLRSPKGRHPELPILLLTVRNATEQIVEGLAAGADEFLSKPYHEQELLARVAALIRSKELRERAELAEANVRKLLAHAPDALLAIDAQGRITYANAEAERVLGLSFEKLDGQPIADAIPDLALRNIAVGNGESLLPLPDVRIGRRLFAPSVRLLPSDDAARTTIALRDITDRREAEARRLDFYSIIAHDLRSPLTSVLLRLDHILRGDRGLISAELQSDVRKMERSLRSLVSMINDFLELARLEGAGYKIGAEPIDVTDIMRQTIDDLEPLVEASQLSIVFDAPSEGALVRGDRQRLGQVVANLFSNAIKFTPPGGTITGRIRVGPAYVEASVEDTGRGIPRDALPKLFERYTRVGVRDAIAGTGLGLMIVREIIEAHGGTVGAESEPGRGSVFWFRLARYDVPRTESAEPEASPSQPSA